MKVAVIHYWWLTNRGGEAVVAEILKIYPNADLFLHVGDESIIRTGMDAGFNGRIRYTFISKLPNVRSWYQRYLGLMPYALEQLDLSEYDLVLSSESGPAKGVVTRPDALHVCYCHSPMRYIWDMYSEYSSSLGRMSRFVFGVVAHNLRIWDVSSAARVDAFVANSSFVSARILKFYRRDSKIIPPPVRVEEFSCDRPRGDFYLLLGQLVKYKRVDMAVAAFNKLGLPLVVIGEGECYEELRKMAGPNIQFLGRQPFSVVRDKLETCKALVFPGVEDFGIVPVEAMAAGAPVIAYNKGGIRDSVINGETGILYDEFSVDGVVGAVGKFEAMPVGFDVQKLKERARFFSQENFRERFSQFISSLAESGPVGVGGVKGVQG
jgi:glycosyltransferase involved in cell wall biosynthesis